MTQRMCAECKSWFTPSNDVDGNVCQGCGHWGFERWIHYKPEDDLVQVGDSLVPLTQFVVHIPANLRTGYDPFYEDTHEVPNYEEIEKKHNGEIADLKSQLSQLTSENANLKNRLSQLEAYIKDIAPNSKILPFAEIVANHKHPIDMDEAEMDAYVRQLTRSYAVGNLKSGEASQKCSTCDRYTGSCDC